VAVNSPLLRVPPFLRSGPLALAARTGSYALAASLFSLLVLGCGSQSSRPSASASAKTGEASGPQEVAVANTVSYGPPVEPIASAGIRSRVSDGGGVTVVNLWATWCAPCRAEMPALLSVARAHKGDGVRLLLVSVDFDDQLPQVRKFLAGNGVDQTTYFKNEPDQQFINAVHPQWSGALPATLVYDKKGRLVEFWEGAGDENRFEHAVIAALTSSN
jgi:thiol-disulfide isomerase/thioredoxin